MNIFIYILLAFLIAQDYLGDGRKCYTCKFEYKKRGKKYNEACGSTKDPRANAFILQCATEPPGLPAWDKCTVTSYFDSLRSTVTVYRACGHSAAMDEEPNCQEKIVNKTKTVRCVCDYDLCNGSGHISRFSFDVSHKAPLIHNKGHILGPVALNALLKNLLKK